MSATARLDISRKDLAGLERVSRASISDVEHVSSYDWVEASTPTIAVPGNPPVWADVKTPLKLNEDKGHVYINQNAARHPDSPLEPLFRAVFLANPQFDIKGIDIVSDRNNIRKLLSFIDPLSTRNGVEDFTIAAELVRDTVILCRTETVVEEFIKQGDFRGFGHEFEKAYTTRKTKDSTGHHRIVSYRLDDLKLLVRHETDGAIRTLPSRHTIPGNATDDLSELLGSVSLSSQATPRGNRIPGSKLTVLKDGLAVRRESTLEIKTRVKHKPISMAETAAQLWISQTPRLVRAYHTRGRFEVPEVEDVTAKLAQWENANQQSLTLLTALLKRIAGFVREHGSCTIKYASVGDRLEIKKAPLAQMLPKDLYLKWSQPSQELAQKMLRDARVQSPLVSKETHINCNTILTVATGSRRSK